MIRIALADDHAQMREIWKLILSRNPAYEVVVSCSSGKEAIAAAADFSPDVFLMDINMQPVSGIEATAIIAKMCPSVKVIGMSIHKEGIYVRRMLEAGAQGYVTKNSSYEEILHAIEEVQSGMRYICKEVQEYMSEWFTTAMAPVR
jgi:two-component system invasion response regulator UvrY